jgi:hypothetical protein
MIVAAIAGNVTKGGEISSDLGDLASLRSTAGGFSGKDARLEIEHQMKTHTYNDMRYTDYGLDVEQFNERAAKTSRLRGMGEGWYSETMKGIGLEKGAGLEQGALMKGAGFDRYGINTTDALGRMVTLLEDIRDSGVSLGDYSRVQEKFDIQQAIMQGYMTRADKPNYDVANQILSAFSATQGITQDSRLGTDIQKFQNIVQNPINDRMRALVYSTVSQLYPQETEGGRVDLIDRMIKNPEKEGVILQAVVQAIVRQYGGTHTRMGYSALTKLLPEIPPERLDAEVQGIISGQPGEIMKGKGLSGDRLRSVAAENVKTLTTDAGGYTAAMKVLVEDLKNIYKTTTFRVKEVGGQFRTTPSLGPAEGE